MAAKSDKNEQSEETFETAMEKLENLVAAMEEETLPLEQLLVSYEEGIRLAKFCSGKLTEAEKRIEIITRKANGETVVEPFDSDNPSGAGSPTKTPPRKSAKSAPEDVRLF